MIFAVLLNIALAVSLALYFNRAAGRRLKVISVNIEKFGKRQPLAATVGGADEIGRLDSFFHEMVAAVEESSRRERAVIDSATDIICSLGMDGCFAFVNPAVIDIWGYEPAEVTGRNITGVIIPDDADDTMCAIRQLQELRKPLTFENRVRCNDGTIADMLWSCQWSESDQLIFCVLQDISERKEMERLKQEFVAIVSHDLRTPINAASAFLELLDMGVYGDLNPKGQRELEKDLQGLSDLTSLIVDLLDVERLEAGRLELERDETELWELMSDAREAVQSFAQLKQVELQLAAFRQELVGDEERLRQALLNLLACAVKLTPHQKAVSVTALTGTDPIELRIEFDVDSTAPALSDSIFETYAFSSVADATEAGGRRLGLPVCKAVIRRHGGRVGVESRGENTRIFWVHLPKPAQPVAASPPSHGHEVTAV